MITYFLLSEESNLPLYRHVMFDRGKLDTKQAKIAVSPWATSADWTPGIWGETTTKTNNSQSDSLHYNYWFQ